MSPQAEHGTWRARLAGWAPRSAAVAAGILVAAATIRAAVLESAPMGALRGTAVMTENGRPIPGTELYLQPIDRDGHGYETHASADGVFHFSHVRAGRYMLSASTNAHNADQVSVTVEEGAATSVRVGLSRSLPDLAVAAHQHIYTHVEKLRLPVRGYVDTAKPAGTDSIGLTIYHTTLTEVLEAGAAGALQQMTSAWGGNVDQQIGALSTLPHTQVVENRVVPLKRADREGFYFQRLEFGNRAPGLYLVKLTHGKASSAAWMMVTDTGLVAKRDQRQTTLFAADIQNGTPSGGATIRAYTGKNLVASATTAADGTARLATGNPSEARDLVIVAQKGSDEALLGATQYSDESTLDYTLCTYTDRPIYRPGQHISYRTIIRRARTDTAPYRLPGAKTVQVELRDPDGERVLRETRVSDMHGVLAGAVDLSPQARTGVYSMITTVDGERHTHDIVIASYRKPEFTVTVQTDKDHYAPGEWVQVSISAQYYFGAPVAGAKVRCTAAASAWWDYSGPDADGEEDGDYPSSGGHDLFGRSNTTSTDPDFVQQELTLDSAGRATVRFRAAEEFDATAPQATAMDVEVWVTDSSEREVEGSDQALLTSGDYRVSIIPDGYTAQPGHPTEVSVKVTDYGGKPVPNTTVDVKEGYANWTEETKESFQQTGAQRVTTREDGTARLTVTPPKAGEFTLRGESADGRGHRIYSHAYLWVCSDQGDDLDTSFGDLSILPEKRHYAPGEKARIVLVTDHVGQSALVTVEGDRVYDSLVVPIKKRTTVVYLPMKEEYGPNIYVNACFVLHKKFAQSEAPLRVSLGTRLLSVSVTPDRPNAPGRPMPRYQPGDRVTYLVKATDSNGRPAACAFSLGVVDEAVYALMEDSPNRLRDAFYPHGYNRVQTSYSFQEEYLGDADKSEPQIVARKKFPDTAYWNPFLTTNAQGEARVTLTLPDNLTTWRATVNACSDGTAVGYAVSKVVSTKDFLIRAETPRFLTQRDRATISAIVHNETDAPQTALVRFVAQGLNVDGADTQTLTVQPGQAATASWNVTATDAMQAKLRFTAWTPGGPGLKQYTDGIESALTIRPHGREQIEGFAGIVKGGKPEAEVVRLDSAAIPAASTLTVRLTPSIVTSIGGALDYLVGYPYGCTEQTMSRFMPDVVASRFLHGQDPATRQLRSQLPTMVRDGLARLYRFQLETGAWGWWQNDKPDAWMTAYVLSGLCQAQDAGYPVSRKVLEKARSAAVQMAGNARGPEKAYLLYAAARTGDKKGILAVRKSMDVTTLPPQGVALLTMLDDQLGLPTAPDIAELRHLAVRDNSLTHWEDSAATHDTWNDRLATALALRALMRVAPNDPDVAAALRWLMSHRTGEFWGDTRDTAAVLETLAAYLALHPDAVAPTGAVDIVVNGAKVRTIDVGGPAASQTDIVVQLGASQLHAGKNDIQLIRTGGGSPVFYSIEMKQVVSSEDIPPSAGAGLTVTREFQRILPQQRQDGTWDLTGETINGPVKVGDNIRVKLTIKSPRDMTYVMIEDLFPAGCEPTDAGEVDPDQSGGSGWSFWYSNLDVRDDRVAFFARTLPKGTSVLTYNLRAQTRGEYHALPALAQAMYSPDIRSESAETRFVIR